MEIGLSFIGTLLVMFGGVLLGVDAVSEHSLSKPIISIFLIIGGYMMIVTGVFYDKEIPAIEVYRGHTTLKITYQDSIPVDTVVVYKKK